MTDRQEHLKNYLTECRQKLMTTLNAISGDDWNVQVQSEGDHWTVLQMVRHLQDAHRGLVGQARRIAAGEPNLPPDFDIDRWNAGAQRKTTEMPPEIALENLRASHEKLLEFIEGLSEQSFQNTGYQAYLKKTLPLDEFIKIIGEHELAHGEEIAKALGKG